MAKQFETLSRVSPLLPLHAAGQEFIDACVGARKAWHRTNLLALTNPTIAGKTRQTLKSKDPLAITALFLEVMGPVAPSKLKDAMGSSSVGHQEMAGLLCTLAVRVAVARQRDEVSIDLADVKQMLVNWIGHGSFGVSENMMECEREATSASKMSDLFASQHHPERVRLAVVAPLAPALESLIVISLISESVFEMMVATSVKVAKTKAMADHLTDETVIDSSQNSIACAAKSLVNQKIEMGD